MEKPLRVCISELSPWEGRMAFYARLLGPLEDGRRTVLCGSSEWDAWRAGLPLAMERERARMDAGGFPRSLTPAVVRELLSEDDQQLVSDGKDPVAAAM